MTNTFSIKGTLAAAGLAAGLGASFAASGALAAEGNVIHLTQTACQFIESENDVDRGFTSSKKADCVAINDKTGEERLSEAKVLRQWAGMADMTPDFAPVMGLTPLENYFIDAGWGTWGFKATPVCGKRMAETVANGNVPEMLEPFRLTRFQDFVQLGEKGAASVGH